VDTGRETKEPLSREYLLGDWKVCSTPAGACLDPSTLPLSSSAWIATELPTTAAATLRDAGLWSLDGPERRFDADDWWFQRKFPATGSTDDRLILGLDGLATLCEVWVNGELLLRSESMFTAHQIHLPRLLAGENLLQLAFRSLDLAMKDKRGRPRWRAPMIENQQLRWFRTTVLGRTPGWSPPAAAVGPWRPVWIERNQNNQPRDISLRTNLAGNRGTVNFRAAMNLAGRSRVRLLLLHEGNTVAATDVQQDAHHSISASIVIDDPRLWWPHTHGRPHLYDVELTSTDDHDHVARHAIGRVGFRSAASLSDDSGNFSIAINGVRIFCRGACWTPIDPVSLNSDEAHYRSTLLQVQQAGMNMLRISGACNYEHDRFFELCDELGILVWQEFMFANMDYPSSDPQFQEQVVLEVSQQLTRWAKHPCIAMICGNSEVSQQASMWGTLRELWNPPLFEQQLRKLSEEICPDVPYWPSSAAGGAFPHQPGCGTSSYYGVGAYMRSFDDLRRSKLRFATECLAFANVPEEVTLAKMPGGRNLRVTHPGWKRRSPRDLGAGWDFDDVRDFYLQAIFKIDPMALRYADYPRYLELSRRVPAEVMEAAFTEWRTSSSPCAGALVWFLRDLWPGAGWGVIDSSGVPKAPYYTLRRMLQPRWIGLTDEGLDGFAVHVANELSQPLQGRLQIAAYREGQHIVFSEETPIAVKSRSTTTLLAAELLSQFHDLSFSYRFGPMSTDLLLATLHADDNTPPLQALRLTQPDLHSRPDPAVQIDWSASTDASGLQTLRLLSRSFVRSVRIDAERHICGDQYFCLLPNEEKSISMTGIGNAPQVPRGFIHALNLAHPVRFDFTP
jgi:beta-mannosidase